MEFHCCAKSSQESREIGKTYAFLRAISDPNRLKILCVLKNSPHCVCELVPIISISNKLVSHHLKQLKKIELVDEKRAGNFIRYSLNKKTLKEYKQIFNHIIK